MNKISFLSKVEDFCELPSRSLNGDETLSDSLLIDSLALLGLISMLDKQFGVNYTINEIIGMGTLNKLYDRIGSQAC